MIVSWNWLKDYVRLDMPAAEFERRLMLAGLNHEETKQVGDDLAIDLEVTSNRPDCLGHIGIAREAAVLFERELKLPPVDLPESGPKIDTLAKVRIDCPQLCPRYTARVIQGVKVGPSPAWMKERLATIGIAAINNIVDITNYVLMECGQPLHAFDLARVGGHEIIVREGRPDEQLLAIDHRTYNVGPGVCVIADNKRAIGVGGVMGGAETEVTNQSRDILLEAAAFDPLSIRTTARRLNLHSDSSFRFERGLDPAGVDWASRRACRLILELAGGTLAAGVIDVGAKPSARMPVVLRLSQLKRILGIDIPPARVRQILADLGNREVKSDADQIEVIPPSWRADLSREIDLVEEVARIHGYDEIPEDVSVPMAASARSREDQVHDRIRQVLVAAGFDEALTLSVVEEDLSNAYSPWTDAAPLVTQMPILRRASYLRRSLVPSLLAARYTNETLSNPTIELFEMAHVYLPRATGLPDEERMLAITTGGDFVSLKGVIEAIVARLNPRATLSIGPAAPSALLDATRCGELLVDGARLGFLGEVSRDCLHKFDLRGRSTVAEVNLAVLDKLANLVPQFERLAPFPAIERDLNLVVDERVTWAEIAAVVRDAAGAILEQLSYRDTYRDAERLGAGKKSILLSIKLRDPQRTLPGEQADKICHEIVARCGQTLGAQLRAM
ncbi:MAG TPA: phenylalanine--tRNA ligase subunit beta [Pirellulales bacterium]|nr:phenylalanine--tRNA ligase subunit beta [Pirellulales bacterium]